MARKMIYSFVFLVGMRGEASVGNYPNVSWVGVKGCASVLSQASFEWGADKEKYRKQSAKITNGLLRILGIGRKEHRTKLNDFKNRAAVLETAKNAIDELEATAKLHGTHSSDEFHSAIYRLVSEGIKEITELGDQAGLSIYAKLLAENINFHPKFWRTRRPNGETREQVLLSKSEPLKELLKNLSRSRRALARSVRERRFDDLFNDELPGLTETNDAYFLNKLVGFALSKAEQEWTTNPAILFKTLSEPDVRQNLPFIRAGRLLKAVAQYEPSRLTAQQLQFVQAFGRTITKKDIERLPEERLREKLDLVLWNETDDVAKNLLNLFKSDPQSFEPFYVGSHMKSLTSGLERRVYRVVTREGKEVSFSMDGKSRPNNEFEVMLLEAFIDGEEVHLQYSGGKWERSIEEERSCASCHGFLSTRRNRPRVTSNAFVIRPERDLPTEAYLIPD